MARMNISAYFKSYFR